MRETTQAFAHSRRGNGDRLRWHLLEEHLLQTAATARKFASSWNAGNWGHLAGLWHDIGKYSAEFQRKVCAGGGENAHIEAAARVDHSTAGAQHANNTLRDKGYGKAIAYVIAGHHGGLPDGISAGSCLHSRLEKQIPSHDKCPPEILEPRPLESPPAIAPDRAGTQLSMFISMLYYCLVDADFLDSEAFMDPQRAQGRQGFKELQELEPLFFAKLNEMRTASERTRVNGQRELVLSQCLEASAKDVGMFSLTAPTGSGKTLSSMAFALRHAMKHGLKRVIYVIPFTSIIEQNADVFRSMLGDDAVLEHHSNFEPKEEDRRSRLAAENWDAPIVVTTNVQFFESLFANRSSCCRKLHNVAESVVILDEVQTLPPPFLLPCLEALKELAAAYRTSIVLCSATQPAIQKRTDFTVGLEGVREIIGDPQELARSLERTQIHVLSQIPDARLTEQLSQYEQVLCVVSTRRHAKRLYGEMRRIKGLYHLSALMCPVHRKQVLDLIRQRLNDGRICRVICTPLIEAGVDIDFPVVFRSVAGIDSIAQAAGRCNREGKLETGHVFVFTPEEGTPPGHLRQTAQAAQSVIRRHPHMLSLKAIEDYFSLYYWTRGDGLDDMGILAMLHAGCQKGDFPFKAIAEKFRFIKDEMKPVIIPFDAAARRLIEKLEFCERPSAYTRMLQKYTVSVHPGEWSRLVSLESVQIRAGMFPVLIDETLYRDDVGLCADNPLQREAQDFVV